MKLYNFSKFNESTESIESICKKYRIENWTIEDGLVNVDGNVDLYYENLNKLPLNFGEVTGYFDCFNNNLTSLEGCPKRVGGNFRCSDNKLTSLKGSPEKVGGEFDCSINKLTSLVGGPKEVWGYYYCYDNILTDVRGFPEYYRGGIYIIGNPVYEIIQLFKDVDRDIIIETLNDYNVIRPNNKVNLQLLKYAFDELEIVMPEIELIKGYEII